MKKDRKYPPQFSLILRLAGGAYLIYLAWSLRDALADSWLYGLGIALFVIVGVLLAGHSALALYRGEFEGGKADPKWDEPSPEEEEEVPDEEPEE